MSLERSIAEGALEAPPSERWQLTRVALSSPPLGRAVELQLEARETVLVGHNGAGKSLFLESFDDAAGHAVRRRSPTLRVGESLACACEVRRGKDRLCYSFTCSAREPEEESPQPIVEWEERCVESTSGSTLWDVHDGVARIAGVELQLERGVGLLGIGTPPTMPAPSGLLGIRSLLSRVRRIPAGVPRRSEPRTPIFLLRPAGSPNARWTASGRSGRDVELARSIMAWSEAQPERFREYVEVGRRVGLWRDLTATVNRRAFAHPTPTEMQDIGFLAADGIEFGLLSDGTLRAAEILGGLVGSSTSVLMIEEPETSIHPGLLGRLMHELDAYSAVTQVVLSTHSPEVVAMSQPGEIRLVRRLGGATSLSSLSPEQAVRVDAYLREEGTLGEFLFAGVSDE